jgi:hypothetical protein
MSHPESRKFRVKLTGEKYLGYAVADSEND